MSNKENEFFMKRKPMSVNVNFHFSQENKLCNALTLIYTMSSSALLSFLLTFSFSLEIVHCFTFRTVSNHAFTGLISQKLYDVDWLSCLEACSRSETCASYNYNWLPDTEEHESVCELIEGSKEYDECDTSPLVYQTGTVFHKIRHGSKVCLTI